MFGSGTIEGQPGPLWLQVEGDVVFFVTLSKRMHIFTLAAREDPSATLDVLFKVPRDRERSPQVELAAAKVQQLADMMLRCDAQVPTVVVSGPIERVHSRPGTLADVADQDIFELHCKIFEFRGELALQGPSALPPITSASANVLQGPREAADQDLIRGSPPAEPPAMAPDIAIALPSAAVLVSGRGTADDSKAAMAATVSAAAAAGTGEGNRNRTWRRRSDGEPKGKGKNNRAAKFVDYLVAEFGYQQLAASAIGALDVAGGAGGVAFELAARRGIPCTVIDPRPVKLTAKQTDVLEYRQRCRQLLSAGVRVSSLAQRLSANYRACPLRQTQAWFGADWASTDEGQRLLAGCTCIVGMHPDQATDAIVDLALAWDKPYSLVPCCVFNNLFQERRTPTGEQVTKYPQLLDYLEAKHPACRRSVLSFEGRNIVLSFNPQAPAPAHRSHIGPAERDEFAKCVPSTF